MQIKRVQDFAIAFAEIRKHIKRYYKESKHCFAEKTEKSFYGKNKKEWKLSFLYSDVGIPEIDSKSARKNKYLMSLDRIKLFNWRLIIPASPKRVNKIRVWENRRKIIILLNNIDEEK